LKYLYFYSYEIAQAKAAMVLSAFGIDQKARQNVEIILNYLI